MWRSRVLILSWTAAVLAAVLAVPAHAERIGVCTPGLGVGLVEVPRGTNDPRASSYIIDSVEPGATFTRRFQVCNGTREPITVSLYANAARVAEGSFTVVEGRVANELSGWIDIEPSRVTVQPGERELATARFEVPEDAEPGERYAVLLAELPPQGSGQVGVASRVGVRVYLDVRSGSTGRSDFRIDSLQAVRNADGSGAVIARATNTGQRALDLTGDLRLTDGPGGLSAGPFPADLGTTLGPGQSTPVVIPLDRAIRGGPWTATLSLKSGLIERRATAQITFPDEAGEQAPPVEAENLPLRDDPNVVIPIAAGLLGLVALLLLLALLRRRTQRQDEEQELADAG